MSGFRTKIKLKTGLKSDVTTSGLYFYCRFTCIYIFRIKVKIALTLNEFAGIIKFGYECKFQVCDTMRIVINVMYSKLIRNIKTHFLQ